jgi:type I restriction enzyme S subunit
MRNGWPTKMLAQVCDVFADGDWIESKDQSREGIRLIQTGNVGAGAFKDRGEKARYISEATFKRLRCTEIFEGDCLISRLPDPVGRSCLLPDTGERMITAVDCTIARFSADQVLPEFFNFYSESLDYLSSVDAETTGTTRKRISRSRLGQIGIPVPPLPEQQRIVGILNEAFGGLATATANAGRNLHQTRALFASHLQAVFTQRGEAKRLDQVCAIIMGQSPDGSSYNTSGEGVPLINGPVEFSPDAFGKTVRTKYTTQPAKYCKENDLILCVRGSTTGRMNIAGFDACIGRGVAAIRARLYQPWINHFINSARDEIYRLGTGATFPNVSGAILGALTLSFPALPEQRRIGAHLDSLRAETQRLEAIYQRKLTALDTLKKALLHHAFTGQL